MQVKSQNFIPVHLDFSSNIAPKSQGAPPDSHLSSPTDTNGPQPERKIDEVIVKKGSWDGLTQLLDSPYFPRSERNKICIDLYHIAMAIGGGIETPRFEINRMPFGAQTGPDHECSAEQDMQNFINGGMKAGDQLNAYIMLSRKLAGSLGSGAENMPPFTSFVAKISSEDMQIFMKAYQDMPVTLTGESGQTLMDFAVNLSGDDMRNFIAAVHNSPDDLQKIIETGSKLSEEDLSNFLAAAANAGEDISLLTDQVNKIVDKQQDPAPINLSSYLSAAAKAGPLVIEFIEATKETSSETTNNIAEFMNNEVNTEQNKKSFLSIIQAASEASINTIIEISSPLAEEDKSNLLDTASRAGKDLNLFVRSLAEFARPDSNKTATDFSNFLTTAKKAEGNLGVLLNISDQLDLAFMSELSTVDTVNFLGAAKDSEKHLDKLVQLGSELSGNDRSNFFYAASQSADTLDNFLNMVEALDNTEKSGFLLDSANKDQAGKEQAIFMRGLLTDDEYNNFQKGAARLSEKQIEDLIDITTGLTGQKRSDFLKTAAASKEDADKLTQNLKHLSQVEQESFIDLAKGLGEKNLSNLIKAVGNTDENYSNFITLADELKKTDRTGLEYFLSAAGDASPEDLTNLMVTVSSIGEKQRYNNRYGVDMRHSFLSVASDAGHNLKGVMDMAKKLLDDPVTGHPRNFAEIFNSADKTSGVHLGAFIKTYV